jgi:hypothetical protein
MPAPRCLYCNRLRSTHKRWTAAGVARTRKASPSHAVTVSGWRIYHSVSPSVVGKYIGHDWRPGRGN